MRHKIDISFSTMRSGTPQIRIDRDSIFALVRYLHARAHVGTVKLFETLDQLFQFSARGVFNGQLELVITRACDPLLPGNTTVPHFNRLRPGHDLYFGRALLPERSINRFEMRFQIVFLIRGRRNNEAHAVVVADLLGTYPPGALCGARHGGNAVKRATAQNTQLGFRCVLRINAR